MTEAIFSGLGGVMMLVGLFLLIRSKLFLGGGYSPVYQFMTSDGQSIVKQGSLSSNPPRFEVGEELDVLYESDKPEKARINRWMNLYFLPALFWGMGLIFAGAGIAIMLG